MAEHASARDIIDEIVHNMHASCEELYSHVLVPSFYQVFLHASDFERIEPILSRIVSDAKKALDVELSKMNRVRLIGRVLGTARRRYEPADRAWRLELFKNPDQDQPRGTVKVVSQLMLPPRPGLGDGAATRFSVTRSDEARNEMPPDNGEPSSPRAEFSIDGTPGICAMVRPEFLIGRGGPDCRVDLVVANASVSEVHVRVYQNRDSSFYLENRGRFGLKVDGIDVPRDTEIRLGSAARIDLANGSAIVQFRAFRREA